MKRMKCIMQLLVLATVLQSAQPIFAAAQDTDGIMSWFSGFSPTSIPGYQTWQNMSTSEKKLTGSIAVLAVLALAGGSYWAISRSKKRIIREEEEEITLCNRDSSNKINNEIKDAIEELSNNQEHIFIFKGHTQNPRTAQLTIRQDEANNISYTIAYYLNDYLQDNPRTEFPTNDNLPIEAEARDQRINRIGLIIYFWLFHPRGISESSLLNP